MLAAAVLFSLHDVQSAGLYLLLRDLLRWRGHDITSIKTRSVRPGIVTYLYGGDDSEGPSAELELATAVIERYYHERNSARSDLLRSTQSLAASRKAAEPAQPNATAEKVTDAVATLENNTFAPGWAAAPPDTVLIAKSSGSANEYWADRRRERHEDSRRPPFDEEGDRRRLWEPSRDVASLARGGQAISLALKEGYAKFIGDLDENLVDFLRQYDVMCKNLSISPGRK
jgi:hypothetical protein